MAQQSMTLRIRQRRRRRLMMLGGILVLLVGGGIAYLVLSPEQDTGRTEALPGTVRVPVIGTNVGAGKEITRRAIRYRYVYPSAIPADALLLDPQIIGRVALRDMRPGAYLKEKELAPFDAPSGLSGLASPGMRVVVVPERQLNASPDHLSPGDRVDVLALSIAGTISGAPSRGTAVERSAATIEGGGSQPGAQNARSRQLARAARSGIGPQLAVSAILISEDAEILITPDPLPRVRNRRVRRNSNLVLQMMPEEAHATTLALAAGQRLRFVYRPYGDRGRVAEVKPRSEITYPKQDVRRVTVYRGVSPTSEYTVLE